MQLVRVEHPEPAAETADRPPPSPTPLPEDAPVLPAMPVKAQQSTPAVAATPAPVTKPAATPLQPFISPTPASIATTAGGKWPTYPPGQMPRGRLANVPDMPELASRGVGGERVYLQGSFVVTASGQDRAVLRSQAALPENLGIGGRSSNTRIIVQFPSGSRPPSEGSTLSRDSRRPFLVTEVRKTSDGQVNVYVREVTRARSDSHRDLSRGSLDLRALHGSRALRPSCRLLCVRQRKNWQAGRLLHECQRGFSFRTHPCRAGARCVGSASGSPAGSLSSSRAQMTGNWLLTSCPPWTRNICLPSSIGSSNRSPSCAGCKSKR